MAIKRKLAASAEDLALPSFLSSLRWLTPRQTCAYLQMSRSTLTELQAGGGIPYSRPSDRVIRFDRLALDKWLAENCTATA